MSGAHLLNQPGNETSGTINWPCCQKCTTFDGGWPVVTAYGIERETPELVEVWVTHHGERDGVIIRKDKFWGPHSLSNLLRTMAFFAPPGEGERRIVRPGMPRR